MRRHWRAARGHGGFTLLEAMLALAVAAVLLTITVPSWGDFAARHRLLAAGEGLVGDLALARAEAVQRGVPVYLLPREGPRWCYAISTEPLCDCRVPAASCALRVVDAGAHAGVELVGGQPVHFDPETGRSDGGAVARWRAGARYAAEVHVHAAGRARLCASGAPMRGAPDC